MEKQRQHHKTKEQKPKPEIPSRLQRIMQSNKARIAGLLGIFVVGAVTLWPSQKTKDIHQTTANQNPGEKDGASSAPTPPPKKIVIQQNQTGTTHDAAPKEGSSPPPPLPKKKPPLCHPDNQEVCNGFDDNCDGKVDEGILERKTYTGSAGTIGIGPCQPKIEECKDGSWKITQPQILPTTNFSNTIANTNCQESVPGTTLPGYAAFPGANIPVVGKGPTGTPYSTVDVSSFGPQGYIPTQMYRLKGNDGLIPQEKMIAWNGEPLRLMLTDVGNGIRIKVSDTRQRIKMVFNVLTDVVAHPKTNFPMNKPFALKGKDIIGVGAHVFNCTDWGKTVKDFHKGCGGKKKFAGMNRCTRDRSEYEVSTLQGPKKVTSITIECENNVGKRREKRKPGSTAGKTFSVEPDFSIVRPKKDTNK